MTVRIGEKANAHNVWRGAMWGGLFALLAFPAIAMFLDVEGFDWSASDFAIMGAMMLFLSLAIKVAGQRVISGRARFITIMISVAAFVLVWVELAVGVIGTPIGGS